MMRYVLAWLAACVTVVNSQQLSLISPIRVTYVYDHLSYSCQKAMNTKFYCLPELYALSARGGVRDEEGVGSICADACLASLQHVKSAIESACLMYTAAIHLDSQPFPFTFPVDLHLYTYNRSCPDNITKPSAGIERTDVAFLQMSTAHQYFNLLSQQPSTTLVGPLSRLKASLPQVQCRVKHERQPKPVPPSQRTPGIPRRGNIADMIEKTLQHCRHDNWGFVVYRTTYDNYADWEEVIQRVQAIMRDTFTSYNGTDVLDKFNLTLMDNRDLFDGANPSAIRQHFNGWAYWNVRTEQPRAFHPGLSCWGLGLNPPRHRYAVSIDAESLHSILHDDPTLPNRLRPNPGWVKLIQRNWRPEPGDKQVARHKDCEPRIEEATEHDAGWMKVDVGDVMTTVYQESAHLYFWERLYEPPPRVFGSGETCIS